MSRKQWIHLQIPCFLLVLLHSGINVCSAGSVTEQSPNPLYTLTGTTPSLVWTYTNPPTTPHVAQFLFGSSVDADGFISSPSVIGSLMFSGAQFYPQLANFMGRLITSWSGNTINITIKHVDLNDSMYYALELWKSGGGIPGMTSKGLNLFVQVPVELTVLPYNKTVHEHGKVSFECQASGHPPPEIIWTKVGEADILSKTQIIQTKQLSSTLVKSTLVFESMKRYDPGVYQCNATNGVKDPVTHKYLLSITYKSNIRPSCKHMGDYYIFHCEVTKSDSTILEYEFNTDGAFGVYLYSTPTKILLAQDEAWWRCRVKTMDGWTGWSVLTKTKDCEKDNPTFRKQKQPVIEECSCSAWKALFGVMAAIFIILAFAAFFIVYKKKIIGFLKGEKYTESPPLTGNSPPGYRINGFTNETNSLELTERQNAHDYVGLNAIQLADKRPVGCNIPETVPESEQEVCNSV